MTWWEITGDSLRGISLGDAPDQDDPQLEHPPATGSSPDPESPDFTEHGISGSVSPLSNAI